MLIKIVTTHTPATPRVQWRHVSQYIIMHTIISIAINNMIPKKILQRLSILII